MNTVKKILLVSPFLILLFLNLYAKNIQEKSWQGKYNVQEINIRDLLNWERQGLGIVDKGGHDQLIMSETTGSKGIMIVSPDIYEDNVVLSFDVMSLNAAKVLIVELLAHNTGNYGLTFPENYDGNVKYLFKNVNMYMFAFHNAAHNKPGPFIRKYPVPGKEPIAKSEKSYMQNGIYYNVELGRMDKKLFLKIDGNNVLETTDKESLEGGKLILRIRGTAHELASCLLRNVKIHTEK